MSTWKTISIFISSTFLDMDAERDYIQKYVIKRLADTLSIHRIQIRPIDLRWGIKLNNNEEENKKNAEILKICFEEIDRSRPFFILLSGERYGWVPSEREYAQAISMISSSAKDILPQFVNGNSVTSLEVIYGALSNKSHMKNSFFFFRDADYSCIPEKDRVNFVAQNASDAKSLNDFKKLIAKKSVEFGCEENIHSYTVKKWDIKKNSFTDLEEFGNEAYECLLKKIKNEMKIGEIPEPFNLFEKEHTIHNYFKDCKLLNFTGRKSLVNDIVNLNYSVEKSNVLILHGRTGYGKSSLISYLHKELSSTRKKRIVLFHSVGISEDSYSTTLMLERFIYEIEKVTGEKHKEYEPNSETSYLDWLYIKYSEIVNSTVANGIEIYILIDNIDKLNTPHGYDPLYNTSNKAAYIMTSTKSKLAVYSNTRITFQDIDNLSEEDARDIFHTILDSVGGKNLDNDIIDEFMSIRNDNGYAYRSPLWIILCCNHLLSMDVKDYVKIRNDQSYIKKFVSTFEGEASRLFTQQIVRIIDDSDGKLITSMLGLISVSRRGIRETDLALLIKDWNLMQFASIRRLLRNVLIEVGLDKQWDIPYDTLKNELKNIWGEKQTAYINCILARYLSQLPDKDYIKKSEIMYHLMKGNMKKESAEHMALLPEEYFSTTFDTIISQIKEDPAVIHWLVSLLDYTSEEEKIIALASHLAVKVYDRMTSSLNNIDIKRMYLLELLSKLDKIVKIHKNDILIFIHILCYYEIACLYKSINEDENAKKNFGIALKKAKEIEQYPQVEILNVKIYTRIGEMMKKNASYNDAIHILTSAKCICEDIFKINKSEPVQDSLLDIYLALGDTYKQLRDIENSLLYYNSYKELKLGVFNKKNYEDEAIDNSIAMERNGDILLQSSKFEEAYKAYNEAKTIILKICDKNPNNISALYNLASLYSKIGNLFLNMSEEYVIPAINNFNHMLNTALKLLGTDQQNVTYRELVAQSALNVAITNIRHTNICNLEEVNQSLTIAYNIWDKLYKEYNKAKYKENLDKISTLYSALFNEN